MINQILNQETSNFKTIIWLIKSWIKKPIQNKHIPPIQHDGHALIPLVGINTLNLYNRLTKINHTKLSRISYTPDSMNDDYKVVVVRWL